MNDQIYDDLAIERACHAAFGVKLNVTEVIARDIPTGYTSSATIFKTSPTTVYVFITSQGVMLLADVVKMLRSMNVEVDEMIPPHGDREYFQRIGTEKFKTMFPGKHITSPEDIRYYQTLAPCSPALARLSKIKGDIRAFHYESKVWRKVKDYAFSKIALVQ